MKLNHQELAALEVVALHHFPAALVLDVSEVRVMGGLGYVMAVVRNDEAKATPVARYLVAPNGDTYLAEFDRASAGMLRGEKATFDQ